MGVAAKRLSAAKPQPNSEILATDYTEYTEGSSVSESLCNPCNLWFRKSSQICSILSKIVICRGRTQYPLSVSAPVLRRHRRTRPGWRPMAHSLFVPILLVRPMGVVGSVGAQRVAELRHHDRGLCPRLRPGAPSRLLTGGDVFGESRRHLRRDDSPTIPAGGGTGVKERVANLQVIPGK